MGNPKIQKIIAIITLGTFVFSGILLPISSIVAAGPYEDDPNYDLSEYTTLKNNGATTGNQYDLDPNSNLSDTNSYNLNISTISQAIPAVVGCTNIVNRVKTSLSSLLSPGKTATTISDTYGDDTPVIAQGSEIILDSNKKKGGSSWDTDSTDTGDIATPALNAIPVDDTAVKNNSKRAADEAAAAKKLLDEAKTREECLNGVAYSLAKGQLAKMTQITVNWINSGFNGDPLYVRDRQSYFQSLSDGQLLNLVGPLTNISNKYIYPFGRRTAERLINDQKANYENKAISTIDQNVIEDRSAGGYSSGFSWTDWGKITQEDQNNPIGFGIMTSEELAKRKRTKEETAKAELAEGNGFLSQKNCIEWVPSSTIKADGTPVNNAPSGGVGRVIDRSGKDPNVQCKRWETVTPGSVIQQQASTALTSSTRQLELADSLNESLSAVFQALVNQLINQGLQSLSSFSPNNAPKTFGGEGSNRIFDSLGNDITNLGSANTGVLTVNKGTGWYDKDGTFDITKDLGDIRKRGTDGKLYIYKKGVITRQKDYIEATKKSLAILPNIMPALGELDYCIPGPNQGWENVTRDRINSIIEYIQSLYYSGSGFFIPSELISQDPVGQVFSRIPGFGMVIGFIDSSTQKRDAEAAKKFAEQAAAQEATFQEEKKQAITNQIEGFSGYKERITSIYGEESPMRNPTSPWYLPMAEEGLQATKFIREYNQNITTAKNDYRSLINQTNANIYKLNVIKGKVDKIVAAARKRRADEMNAKGIPMIDPSCSDLTGVEGVTNGKGSIPAATGNAGTDPGQVVTGTTTGTKNPTQATGTTKIPTGGGATTGGVPSPLVAGFDLTVSKTPDGCYATVSATNKSTGAVVDNSWGVKIGSNPTIYSAKTVNLSSTFDTISQSGAADVTLTIKDTGGSMNSLSKPITIPKTTKKITARGGTTCQ